MKKIFIAAALAVVINAHAQTDPLAQMNKEIKHQGPSIGIKAGYNVASLSGSNPDFSFHAKNGFMIAGFFATAPRTGMGYRSEVVFSRQGFGFTNDGKTNSVQSDYIYLPQLTTIGIGKFLQLQVGGQIGYLLRSSASESANTSEDITATANRIDYGGAAGFELYPVKGLILGGRYNISFGKAFKEGAMMPPASMYDPQLWKGKNAVINLFVGFRF